MAVGDTTARVVAAAAEGGLALEIHEHPVGTKTAKEAADAVGCELGAIVKSLVFLVDGRPVMGLVSGDRRLDTFKFASAAGGAAAKRASLEDVRTYTGYAAGGTPPFGHATDLQIYADESLRRFATVWAAGGTPRTVFPISLDDLIRVSGASWADIADATPI